MSWQRSVIGVPGQFARTAMTVNFEPESVWDSSALASRNKLESALAYQRLQALILPSTIY